MIFKMKELFFEANLQQLLQINTDAIFSIFQWFFVEPIVSVSKLSYRSGLDQNWRSRCCLDFFHYIQVGFGVKLIFNRFFFEGFITIVDFSIIVENSHELELVVGMELFNFSVGSKGSESDILLEMGEIFQEESLIDLTDVLVFVVEFQEFFDVELNLLDGKRMFEFGHFDG